MALAKKKPEAVTNGPQIVENINALLYLKGVPKMSFYRACGITASAYSQWKSGLTVPTLASLDKISKYLGVSMTDLMDKKIDPPKSVGRISNDDLTLEEKTVIDYFRRATPEQRQALAIFLKVNGSPGAGPGAPSTSE